MRVPRSERTVAAVTSNQRRRPCTATITITSSCHITDRWLSVWQHSSPRRRHSLTVMDHSAFSQPTYPRDGPAISNTQKKDKRNKSWETICLSDRARCACVMAKQPQSITLRRGESRKFCSHGAGACSGATDWWNNLNHWAAGPSIWSSGRETTTRLLLKPCWTRSNSHYVTVTQQLPSTQRFSATLIYRWHSVTDPLTHTEALL